MVRYFNYLKNVDDKEANRIVKIIREFMHIAGDFVPSDLIPIIGWFPIEGKVLKNMKRVGKDMDKVVGSWVKEHQDMKITDFDDNDTSEKQDFIDVMLSVIEDDPSSGYTRDNIIKANITNLILAGSDTKSIAMTWILVMLLRNKHALKRAQEEIDLHVGKNRKVEASDVKNLVYLQATFKETLRLYPPGPLLVPHEAREDCYIHGFYVPKGTRVFANVWKLHRDASIWSEPERFSPERFINGNNGELDEDHHHHHHFEYLPFGLGRRACPGSTFATQVTLMKLARLLQRFDLDVGMEDEPIDIREGFGITLPKLTPLTILLTQRVDASI
ncbi:hypothetical protein PIB30_048586 [Stylosanthes scabra]|uniref:Cytochrome P450 n=1 Tax=Stylosanthes scabra TaxID=79078 RepID=A0ABU6YI77_9FABA|nr:hypothetical protein [Stylosanthes scabra]